MLYVINIVIWFIHIYENGDRNVICKEAALYSISTNCIKLDQKKRLMNKCVINRAKLLNENYTRMLSCILLDIVKSQSLFKNLAKQFVV